MPMRVDEYGLPRISLLKLFGKSGLGLKSRPHRLPREGKKSYLALLGPQYLPLQRPPANYQTVSLRLLMGLSVWDPSTLYSPFLHEVGWMDRILVRESDDEFSQLRGSL